MSVTFPESLLGKRARTIPETLTVAVDYESGTFTPTITDSSSNSFDGVTGSGFYVRIGPLVFINLTAAWTGKSSVVGGDIMRLGGFPFNNTSLQRTTGQGGFEYTGLGTWPTNATQMKPVMLQVQNYLKFVFDTSTGSSTTLFCSQVNTSGTFRGSYMYRTDAD